MISPTLNSILIRIAENEYIKTPEFVVDESPSHGYMANVNTITLKDLSNCKVLHLFLKMMPENVPTDFKFLYENEANFYAIVIKAFNDIAAHNNRISSPLVPKTYHVEKHVIIMENMYKSEYKIWNPLDVPLDEDHTKVVLAAYGKFHAFSFALRRKKPDIFNGFGVKFEWFKENHQRLLDDGFYRDLEGLMSAAFDPVKEKQIIEANKHFLNEGQVSFFEELDKLDETCVYIHGDSWTHNFMFSYDKDDEKKPKDACILDFQLLRKCSPVLDISYFLSTSACTSEVFDNIKHYLKHYHNSLQRHLLLLDCPASLYTWETLLDEWHKFSLRGFVMSSFVNKMMIADKDELAERKDIPVPHQFIFTSRNEDKYKKRMRILMKYFYDSGIYSVW